MRLTDLNPKYGQHVGNRDTLIFDCPKCKAHRITVPIPPAENAWQLTGDCFENLSLLPSIDHTTEYADGIADDPRHCNWHGFVTDGKIITV